MNSEALNPMSVIPPPAAEGGSAVPASAIQPQNPIVPAFKLPDDGSKLQDRKQKQPQRPEELQEDLEDTAAQFTQRLNDLVDKPVFADLFYRLFNGLVVEIDQLQREAFNIADIGERGTFSSLILKHAEFSIHRDESYDKVLFYHSTLPGRRFSGKI